VCRVSKSELTKMEKVHMVETAEQLQFARTLDHLHSSQFTCIGNEYYRICAPEESDSKMYSCILWTKDSAEDVNPTWEKVVSASRSN
jgi:hypothetical protein